MGRWLRRLFLLLLLVALATPVVLVLAALGEEPVVASETALGPEDIARAKALVRAHDPRRMEPGAVRTLALTEADLNLLLRYGLGRLVPAAAAVDLHPGAVQTALTWRLPDNPLAPYANARFRLAAGTGRVRIQDLRLGRLAVPDVMAEGLLRLAHRALSRDSLYRDLLATVNGLRLTESRLLLVYQWRPEVAAEAAARGRDTLLPPEQRARLLAYQGVLAETTRRTDAGERASLLALMEPLFRHARERGGDPVAENRAALLVLGLYFQGVDLGRLLAADDLPRPRPGRYALAGREDFAQHFVISAGVAVAGGGRLADAVGLFKEVDDSRGGSGFSFTDLAADRAGVRFAETATASPETARRVQDLLAAGAGEADLMPVTTGLAEFMDEAEFRRRFGGIGAPGYRREVAEIEERIDALPVHR
jgi:hypothetical protein